MNKESIDLLLNLIFNPLVEDGKFKEDYVEMEKNNIKLLIESKIDNKEQYALNRCIEEMYKNKPYGLYKYGYVEDLKNINSENLYNYFTQLINMAKIDIIISGDLDSEKMIQDVLKNENINKLEDRDLTTVINNEQTEIKEEIQEIKKLEEKMDIAQGKLVLGLDVCFNKEDSRFPILLYNVILGEGATSKLFQNVREKASLAYSARSNYVKQKGNIFIKCGIEIENYNKTLEIIEQQLEDMKKGNFTNEDLQTAKKYVISGMESVQDEQDSEIIYYFGQEMSGKLTTIKEYIDKINNVTFENIIEVANNIKINTIYFLRN